jgi:succinate dehydrogenase hydrophobic anchor subunit
MYINNNGGQEFYHCIFCGSNNWRLNVNDQNHLVWVCGVPRARRSDQLFAPPGYRPGDDTATVYFFPSLYGEAIAIYRSTIFGLAEMGLLFCVFYHGVNGLRIAFFDMIAPKNWEIPSERKSALVTLAVTLVIWLPAVVIMGRNLLINNFGLFGG